MSPGLVRDEPFISVGACPDAAALEAEREPLLQEAAATLSLLSAVGMHAEPAEAADTKLVCHQDPSSQPDMAPSITASAEHMKEIPDQDKKAGAAEQLEPAQSSPNSNRHSLLKAQQQSAGQPAAASRLDHVLIAASPEELHDQEHAPTEQSRQQEAEADTLQDLPMGHGLKSQKCQAPGTASSPLNEVSTSHAHGDAALKGATLVQGIPLPGGTERSDGRVEHMASTVQEGSRAAPTQTSPAWDTHAESAGLAAEPSDLKSGSESGQADMGMPKQAEMIAASKQTDGQAGCEMAIDARAAPAPEEVLEANAEGSAGSAPHGKPDRPGRVFPLLDWALAENKVRDRGWVLHYVTLDTFFVLVQH